MNRISRYYPGCDGTQLAVDLYLPETDKKVPVIFLVGRDLRRERFDRFEAMIRLLVKNEYAVALSEPRGVGSSFGWHEGFHIPFDGRDVAHLIETIAAEPWCSGKAGMFGGSNLGNIQELTAIHCPPALKCIIPCDCNTNMYYQNYPNGASALPVLGKMPPPPRMPAPPVPAPVDEDTDGSLLAKAQAEHGRNGGFLYQYLPNMHRDSLHPALGYATNLRNPIWSYLDQVRYSDIQVYQNAAWYDPGCTGSLITYKYWGGKVLLGPWSHTEIYRDTAVHPNGVFDWKQAHLDFFDAVLKGSDPKCFLQEPDIRYYTRNAAPGTEWRYSPDWPLDNQAQVELSLTADGCLAPGAAAEGTLSYKVREDIRLFGFGRLNRRLMDGFTGEQEKCMCFTTEALPGDLEVTGIPVLELTASSTWRDGNFLAMLLDVAPDGTAEHITEGSIRASHRKTDGHPAWDALGLPYHASLEGQDDRLDNGPQHMAFNLEGISYVVKQGHKLRLCVFCGAEDTYQQPEGMPEDVTVTLHTGKNACFLRLPVSQPDAFCFTGTMEGTPAEVYPFRRGVWIRRNGAWEKHLCSQAYPSEGRMRYVTEDFTLVKETENGIATVSIDAPGFRFRAEAPLPRLWCWEGADREIRPYRPSRFPPREDVIPNPTYRNEYVASVPVRKGRRGVLNTECYATKDLFVDIALPETGTAPYPCIVNIHGFGESHHDFLPIAPMLLEKGYAVASVQYRTCPPNVWPYSGMDVKGCIRFLKANAEKFQLDPQRFGIMGGSMGGHMSAMLAADNGKREFEYDIAGNLEFDSGAKAAAIYYPWTDFFTFGDGCFDLYPGRPERVNNCDAAFSPLGAMVGFNAAGEGAAVLKRHTKDLDPDPTYKALLELAHDCSPVEHIHRGSMESVIVHGIGECPIQIPINQSIQFFEKLTEAGVRAQLYCNGLRFFGNEPEIKKAVVEFLTSRV